MLRRALSIRARLTLWYTALLLAILATVSALAYSALRAALLRDADASLLTVAKVIAATSVEHPGGASETSADAALRDLLGPELYDKFFRLVDPGGHTAARSPGRGAETLRLSALAARNAALGLNTFETVEGPEGKGVRVLTVPIVSNGRVIQLVQVGIELDRVYRVLRWFAEALVMLVPFGVVLAGVGGLAIAARALRPLDDISRTARQITIAEDLTQRIPMRGTGDELDRLGDTLNVMLSRLQAAFAYVRRTAADAAHELRTPLTAIKGGLDVALRADRSAAEYRAAIESAVQEVDRLIRLSEDLLLWSRARAGLHEPRGPVDLEPLVLEVAETLAPLAKQQRVSVDVDIARPVAAVAAATSLRRALLNVVENAIRYSDAGGMVRVTLDARDGAAVIEVTDRGPGIASGDVERIFEPFVRLESARGRHEGGSGLGLAIARSIADAHGGSLTVSSPPGAGSRFTLTVPAVE